MCSQKTLQSKNMFYACSNSESLGGSSFGEAATVRLTGTFAYPLLKYDSVLFTLENKAEIALNPAGGILPCSSRSSVAKFKGGSRP
jgi:hypothetical protein